MKIRFRGSAPDRDMRYFVEGEGRAAGVQSLFASIAQRYDLINDVQSFGAHRLWKRRLASLSKLQPGDRALDICCGTGDVAFLLAGRGSSVVGVDFCEEMLDVARSRAASAPQASVTFQHGDALELPFDDASFDVVTMAYGLRNLADLKRGLSEMRRVVRPGGRLLIFDFSMPRGSVLRTAFRLYLKTVVPLMGQAFHGDRAAYAYILESLERFPDPRSIAEDLLAMDCEWSRARSVALGAMGLVSAQAH